jgi:hypothetical protein
MTTSAKRKCLHCQEFFRPDHRNLHQQRYCSKFGCAGRVKLKVSVAGYKSRKTKITSAARTTASVSKTGASAIPVTGAKRSLGPKNRYKKSAGSKQLKVRNLAIKRYRMRYKISWRCNRLSLLDLSRR